MVIPVVTQLVRPAAAELAEVAGVFDQYRRHYGEPVTAGQALGWLTQHTGAADGAILAGRWVQPVLIWL